MIKYMYILKKYKAHTLIGEWPTIMVLKPKDGGKEDRFINGITECGNKVITRIMCVNMGLLPR